MSADRCEKFPLCPLCGNPVTSTDKECQSGGPAPDGCGLFQYGARDRLRDIERRRNKAAEEAGRCDTPDRRKTLNVEKHPGPFSGPDVELARACAMAVLPWYGNDDGETHQRIMVRGIGNDHIAVQAALAAIHYLRQNKEHEA